MSTADPITRLNAALEGRYHVARQLGEGGMATVSLADDLRHERKVALKVLKPELAAVVGAERFLAEIKTTANLQHPHILPLFDSGEADSFLFYVMPYVEGESLRERLDREHQLPVDEAVRIAGKVAGALQAAHDQGVIHRDIKPANILLSKGEPLVSDFGIALALSAGGAGRLTETGLSLGTPHYMSPEQATGDLSVGKATDIYALGCVLYEMLVGEPPYTGSTPQAVLGKIVTGEADPVTKHRRAVPANVDGAVRKALERVPADRFGTARDLVNALSDGKFRYAVGGSTEERAGRDRPLVAGLATVSVALAVLFLWGWLRPTEAPSSSVPTRTRVTGFDVDDVVGERPGWRLAISPDGRWIAAVGVPEAEGGTLRSALYVRSAEDVDWRLLPNTEGADSPTFSPDGQWLAFSVGSQISRVPVSGGPALPITSGRNPQWGLDGSIVYTLNQSLYRIRAIGSEPELLLSGDSVPVFRPHILPDGRAVVFGTGAAVDSDIRVFDIESGEVRELLSAGTNPRFVAGGYLVFAYADGALMGVRFDPKSLQVSGSPVVLLPEMSVYAGGSAQFAVSETGTLVYGVGLWGNDLQNRTLVEVTLDGVESPLPLSAAAMDGPRYSPDGTKIAYGNRASGEDELRIYDLATGTNRQVGVGGYPTWSPDGDFLYFSLISPVTDAYRRPVDESEDATQLWSRPGGEYIVDVSAGDSILVVRQNSVQGGRDLLLVRQRANGPVFEDFLTAEWNELNGDISPDGRWIAYQSDETGEYRVYVHRFPVITGRHSVSPGRGADPVWAPDGRTLYYRDGSRFMAVDVTTDPDFAASAPRVLFDRPEYSRYVNPGPRRNWDIHPDGSHFITVKSAPPSGGSATSSDIYLVTNWFEELRERMGEN